MNFNEWYKLKKTSKSLLNWDYYNKAHKLLKEYNCANCTNKCVIHHLRDTEEQRKYNDEYYELWGHNLDGTFEYGKYVIFVTKEEHTEIHKCSEETRKKISQALTGRSLSDETRKRLSESHLGIKCLESTKELFRKMYKGRRLCFEFSDEARKKMSAANKGKTRSEEFKHHLSIINSDSGNPFYGNRHSDETKKIIKQKSNAYWSLEESRISHSKLMKQYYKNNPISDETKRKLSESLKGHSCSEECIQHIKHGRANSTKVAEHNKNMQVCKEHYSLIKEYNFISWNNFQKLFKKDYYLLKAIITILFHIAIQQH